jgi:hypothetical protein
LEQRRGSFESTLRQHALRPELVERFLAELAPLKRTMRSPLQLVPCSPGDATHLESGIILATGVRATTVPVTCARLSGLGQGDVDWLWLHKALERYWKHRLFTGDGPVTTAFRSAFDADDVERWPLVKSVLDRMFEDIWERLPERLPNGACARAGAGIRTALYYAAWFALCDDERSMELLMPLVKYLRWYLPLGHVEGKGLLWIVGEKTRR